MATYKKQLKDQNGDNIIPALGTATVTGTNIDWTTTAQSYSTTEMDTGATWIDGKPIYKKTVSAGSLPNAATKNVAHGISNLGTVIKMEGYAYESPSFVPLPFVTNSDTSQIYLIVNATNIIIGTGTNRSGFSGYITLWYTKTTD